MLLLLALFAGGGAVVFGSLAVARAQRVQPLRAEFELTTRMTSITDAATASLVRRWSEPWLRPFPTLLTDARAVVLLPGAAYHLAEISPLADELERRGFTPIVCVGEPHWERTQPGLFWLDRPTYEVPTTEQLQGAIALVTMKDWAGYRPTVEAAKNAGILTVAIVEGAQDFDDLHQPVEHRPYRTADLVLCQGLNDAAALSGRNTVVVGSNRLEELTRVPRMNLKSKLAVVNVNFSYGVLIPERDAWVKSAVGGCIAAGMPYILAIHPASADPSHWQNATRLPISSLLPRATVLISRFSTVPFEAIARGIRFIYHNPHGEGMPAFADAAGAFPTTSTAEELTVALLSSTASEEIRQVTKVFFSRQVDIQDEAPPSERSADAIEAALVARQGGS